LHKRIPFTKKNKEHKIEEENKKKLRAVTLNELDEKLEGTGLKTFDVSSDVSSSFKIKNFFTLYKTSTTLVEQAIHGIIVTACIVLLVKGTTTVEALKFVANLFPKELFNEYLKWLVPIIGATGAAKTYMTNPCHICGVHVNRNKSHCFTCEGNQNQHQKLIEANRS
jgi:hypothetical protein